MLLNGPRLRPAALAVGILLDADGPIVTEANNEF